MGVSSSRRTGLLRRRHLTNRTGGGRWLTTPLLRTGGRTASLAAVAAAAAAVMTGCSSQNTAVHVDAQAPDLPSPSSVAAAAPASGTEITLAAASAQAATRASSAQAESGSPSTPADAGTTGGHSDADSVNGMAYNGTATAVLTHGTVFVGTAEEWDNHQVKTASVDAECTDLTRTADGFSVACPGKVVVVGNDGTVSTTFDVDGRATTATVTSSGATVSIDGQSQLTFISRDGSTMNTAPAGSEPKQSVLVTSSAEGNPDEMIALYDRQASSLTGVYPGEKKEGSSLRIGQGAGQISGGEQGVVVASAPSVNQVDVFTGDGIIRKHMSIPTGTSPWGVAWDANTHTVWVTNTGDNTLVGYDISSGTGVEVARFTTASDAEYVALDGAGGLLVASGSAGSVRHISAAEVDQARSAAASSFAAGESQWAVTPVG